MEKRIELEKRGRDASQIHVLNLDNTRSTTIVALTNDFINLEYLSLVSVGLITLKGFPKLPNLKQLELSDNLLSSGLNYLTQCTKLKAINLSDNKISDLKALEPLKEFKNLINLDLYNNDVTSIANYRSTIFSMIPTLKSLDDYDSDDDSDNNQDNEGYQIEEDNDDDDNDEGGDEDEEEEEQEDGDDDFESSEDEPVNKQLDLRAVYNDNLDELSDDEYKLQQKTNRVQQDNDDSDDDEDEEEEDDDDEENQEEFRANLSRGKKRKFEDLEETTNN